MLEQYIARIVTFVVTPVILVVVPVVANAVQDYAGMDLDEGALAAYLTSATVGAALALFAWIKNRGEWEIVVGAGKQVEGWHDAGEAVEPQVPPGVQS